MTSKTVSDLDSYEAIRQAVPPVCVSGVRGGAGQSRGPLARWSTRIRRNAAFLTKMPYARRTGSGRRDPSLATAVNPVELRSHATPARPARHEPACRANPVGQAAFSRAPSGTSPVVTYFHSATSSFLARATAAILRMRPRTAPTRSANRRARALSGW